MERPRFEIALVLLLAGLAACDGPQAGDFKLVTADPLSGTGQEDDPIKILDGGITNALLANPEITVTAGTGLTGGGKVALAEEITLRFDGKNAVTASAPLTATGDNPRNIALSGIIPVDKGGTGLASPGVAGTYLRSTGMAWESAPIKPDDLPPLSASYIQADPMMAQAASFNITGNGTIGGNVGIGTSSPYARVGVRKDKVVKYSELGDHLDILIQHPSAGQAGGALAQVGFGYPPRKFAAAVVGFVETDNSGQTAGDLILATSNSTDGQIPPTERMRVTRTGNVGIGTTTPTHRLHVVGDIYATGPIVPNSSRSAKQGIRELAAADADAAFRRLRPSRFAYKAQPDEEKLVFVAEDVPELVAQNDRKGVDPLELVALLTKVVQEQQKEIALQRRRIDRLEAAAARRP